METRQFGKTDMQVSVLGFGGAEIGFEKATTDVVERVLGGALDAGLNVIDTAECYLESEELIGRAVRWRRDDFYLFTKCGHFEGSYKEDWRPESLIKSIERSLQRLKTDRLDLVQLHSCSEAELRKGDVIEALRDARDRGYTRYIGYSGDGQAARYAIDCGAFDSLQTSVSIADQEAIELTLPLARDAPDWRDRQTADRQRGLARTSRGPTTRISSPTGTGYKHLAYDFLKGDPQQVGSTALRFTLSIPGVHTAIVGTSRPGRWLENARLLEAGSLPVEQFEAIRARWRKSRMSPGSARSDSSGHLSQGMRGVAPRRDHPEAMGDGLNTRHAHTRRVHDSLRIADRILNLHHVHPVPVHHDREVACQLPGIHHRDASRGKGVAKSHG